MRRALVALVVVACGKSEQPDKRPPPIVTVSIDAPPPVDAALVLVDAAQTIAPTATAVTATTDGNEASLRYGYAEIGSDGLYVTLFSAPLDCQSEKPLDGHAPGVEVRIHMHPGPGGSFFAGHPATADVFVWNRDQKLDVPNQVTRVMGEQAFQASLNDASSLVTLEPVPRNAHAHVKGTIDADSATLIGAATVRGTFDVELCRDAGEIESLRATAPASPARGRRGATTIAPRSYQAIVWTGAATRDEAVQMTIDKSRAGSRAQIFLITGYAQANVPCPPPHEMYAADVLPVMELQIIGGSSREHPVAGVPQPTSFSLQKKGERAGVPDIVWPAWISVDALDFTPGAKLHATVWAQSPGYDDKKGTFGGRIEAVVCVP